MTPARRPCSRKALAKAITTGVLPVPPTVRFPMLITVTGSARCSKRPMAYNCSLVSIPSPYRCESGTNVRRAHSRSVWVLTESKRSIFRETDSVPAEKLNNEVCIFCHRPLIGSHDLLGCPAHPLKLSAILQEPREGHCHFRAILNLNGCSLRHQQIGDLCEVIHVRAEDHRFSR